MSGRGPGFQGGGDRASAAFCRPPLSVRGARRGRCGCRALPATSWGRARGQVGVRRPQCLRGALGLACASLEFSGFNLCSRAPAPGKAGNSFKNGSAPHPNLAARSPVGIATLKVKKDPPLPPRLPLFKFRGSGDILAVRGTDASLRKGSRRGLSVWGTPRPRGVCAGDAGLGDSASAMTTLVGPRRRVPPLSRRPPSAHLAGVRLLGGAGERMCVDTCVCERVCVCARMQARKYADRRGGGRSWTLQVAL